MRFLILRLSLALALLSACTAKPEAPNFRKYDSGDGTGVGPKTGGGVVPPKSEVAPQYPTEISLANTKFKGEEGKLEVLVKYAGASSAKLKLSAEGSKVKISVPKLAADKSESLVVEIYEGDKLRFKAIKTKTQIEKTKATEIAIEDCAIQKMPWTGEANEALCGWTVEDVKN